MLDQRSKKIIKKKHKKKFSGRKKELQIRKDKNNHDPETGRTLVDRELVRSLEPILRDPAAHPRELARAVQIAIGAFGACVARVGGGYGRLEQQHEFMVQQERVFDEVIRLCFQCMSRCLYQLLNPIEQPKKENPVKKLPNNKKLKDGRRRRSKGPKRAATTHFKHWHRFGALAKQYLQAVHVFLVEIQHAEVVVCALRAVAELADLYLHFPKLCKQLIKQLVRCWSRHQEEQARCMAFVGLCKMARLDPMFFPIIYKSCYTAYIANCKVVDEQTLPFINFMQHTLAELTFLHPADAYQYAFVYIRQFAIHLRNAMIAKRKDLIQTVYNWQFVKGLQLWAVVLCEGTKRFGGGSNKKLVQKDNNSNNTNWFRELVHPLVEVINALWRLFPSGKFLPLRIHCIRLLLTLQRNCDVFIPTLASAVELLDELAQIDAKKPSTGKGAVREPCLDRMLRLSREQLEDAGVRLLMAQQLDALVRDCAVLLTARERAAPAIAWPVDVKFKRSLKKCANREHVRLLSRLKGLHHFGNADQDQMES